MYREYDQGIGDNMRSSSPSRGLYLLKLVYHFFLTSIFFVGTTLISPAMSDTNIWATPSLDADQNWGRGPHMSLTNPAQIGQREDQLSLSYDLFAHAAREIWQLKLDQPNLAAGWGHEVNVSFQPLKDWTTSLGYLSHSQAQSLSPAGSQKGVIVGQSIGLSTVRLGLTGLFWSGERAHLVAGASASLSSWFKLTLTLDDLTSLTLNRGGVSTGLGFKASRWAQLGITATPMKGGGFVEARAQISLWRGLALEIGWLSELGEINATRASMERGITPSLSTAFSSAQQDMNQTLRFALAWRGASGWRVESGLSQEAPASIGFRLQSEVVERHSFSSPREVILVSAQDASEISAKPSILSVPEGEAPFFQTLQRLAEIEKLPVRKVAAIVLLLGGDLGWAQLEELVAQIDRLRLLGHVVYAYLPSSTPRTYLVAAACDAIWASPTAEILVSGILLERLYFKGLLDRLKVIPEVLAAGEYKSAPEVFTRSGPSPEADEVDQRLLDLRFSRLVNGLSRRAAQQKWATEASPSLTRGKRLISLKKLKEGDSFSVEDKAKALEWLNGGPYSARSALKSGLVDQLISPAALETTLQKSFRDAQLAAARPPERELEWTPLPQIAVIHASGTIGSEAGPSLGRETAKITASGYVPLIKRATFDPLIHGVILRVDSPGGTITDADAIWTALTELAKRKPLAISMGNTAASGGYYIAAPAHVIFASPSTLTGSIGVFAGKVDLSGLVEGFGVSIHRVTRGEHGGTQSLFTPWSTQTRRQLNAEIDQVYDLFLERIHAGRPELTRERILPLAGGRVWMGSEAKERGLIDQEGGLLDTIEWMRSETKLIHKPHTITSLFPIRPSLIDKAIGVVGMKSQSAEALSSTPFDTRLDSVNSTLWNRFVESDKYTDFRAIWETLPLQIRAALTSFALSPGAPLVLDPRFR